MADVASSFLFEPYNIGHDGKKRGGERERQRQKKRNRERERENETLSLLLLLLSLFAGGVQCLG